VFPHQGQSELSTNTSSRKDNPTFGRLMKRSGVVFNLIPFTVPASGRNETKNRQGQSHSMRTNRRPIAIMQRHVLIRR
jgi:hypothetical protein